MYIDIVPNRKSPPAILLRESIRKGEKIVKRTLANLSNLSIDQAQAIRRILKGVKLVQPEKHFTILRSRAHGHAEAVLLTIRRLGLDKLIFSRRCKERDLVIAMIGCSNPLSTEQAGFYTRPGEYDTSRITWC